MIVKIEGELTTLNEYIDAERTNRYRAASIKKEETERCAWYFKGKPKPTTLPMLVTFVWYSKNERKDPDNIAFAKKFILDGMVIAGLIPNDGRKQILAFRDQFFVDKKNPRVEVVYA